MMGSVAVLGSINLDHVITVDAHPLPGETVLGKGVQKAAGGKGANQAVAAARLGANVRMYGLVGNDDVGNELIEGMRVEAVDITGLGRAETVSGTAYLTLADSGENSIVVIPGANAFVGNSEAEQLVSGLRAGDIVVIQLEIPISTVRAAVMAASRAGARVLLNAAPAQEIADFLPDVDVLVVNESEASFMAGSKVKDVASATAAATALNAQFGPTVVVTLGSQGVVVADAAGVKHIPSVPVEVLDTTGAGDTFVGALATKLAEGAEMESAVRFATGVAAIACTQLGARAGMPRRADLPQDSDRAVTAH